MDFDIAQSLIAFATDEAARRGFAVSVVVVDAAACPVASARMAGGPGGSVEAAFDRAMSAARISTDGASSGLSSRRTREVGWVKLPTPERFGSNGGIVLRNRAGDILGALGIAGAGETVDEAIARATAASFHA